MAYPETELDLTVAQTKRWTLCQSLVQGFWKRWSKEYLSQLQAKYKWKTEKPNLAVGDIVLMKDSSYFQTHWGLARVVKLHPGEDGLVRAVDVAVCKVTRPDSTGKKKNIPLSQMKVKTATFRRPVCKLSLLLSAGRGPPAGGGCSVDQPTSAG